MLTPIDDKVIKLLKESKIPLSTYEIAKKSGICWTTANSHCYKLKSLRLIKSKEDKSEHGSQGKVIWWIK